MLLILYYSTHKNLTPSHFCELLCVLYIPDTFLLGFEHSRALVPAALNYFNKEQLFLGSVTASTCWVGGKKCHCTGKWEP